MFRVPTGQGKVREIWIFFKVREVREFWKMVRKVKKSSKVTEKSENFKIMLCSNPSKIEQIGHEMMSHR